MERRDKVSDERSWHPFRVSVYLDERYPSMMLNLTRGNRLGDD